MITYTNKLNMTPGQVPVTIHVNQYDSDFSLVFDLYNTVGTFTVESGTTAAIRGTKTDGTGYSVDATLDISNKRVTVSGDQQMTAAAGINVFELVLTKNSKELNTANFVLDVERAALDKDTITSESVIRELIDVIDRADEIIAAAEQVVNRFGTCNVSASTAAKTVSITTGTFSLEAGARVSVRFTYPNTASIPTLNVNSTGAKSIYHKGSQITSGDNKTLLAGVVDFIYDGTQWHLIGNYVDTNTTYTGTSPISVLGGAISLEDSGVSAASRGDTTNQTPGFGQTFKVPSGTVDAKGRLTAFADHTVTIPNKTATTESAGLMSSADKTAVDKIGDTIMDTTATTITGAIAEHETDISNLNSNLSELETDMANMANSNFPEMSVGSADQLISDGYVVENEPYQFRKSGGSADIGTRMEDAIVGGSIVWNQLANKSRLVSRGGTGTWSDDVYVLTADGTYTSTLHYGFQQAAMDEKQDGHVVFASCTCKSIHTDKFRLHVSDSMFWTEDVMANTWTTVSGVANIVSNSYLFTVYANDDTLYSSSDALSFKNVVLFDLTAMFGSTIADYIYSLEQANQGDGVAFFRKFFPKDYYAYNAGELMSVSGLSEHKTVGFNLWDEEWEVGAYNSNTGNKDSWLDAIRSVNKYRCIPNTQYCITFSTTTRVFIYWYDVNDNYLGYNNALHSGTVVTSISNAFYFTVCTTNNYGTTYNHDICINLSDPTKNGTYEPYKAHSYPLDDSLTLRGIPKLDSNNQLYFDGDIYESDGKVTRRYGIVDLGTFNWSLVEDHVFYNMVMENKVRKNQGVFCSKYANPYTVNTGLSNMTDKTVQNRSDTNVLYIKDSDYSDAATFKTAMSGVYLVYELETPTTEQATPYHNPQIVDPEGTEEYVCTSLVPVGHETKYFEDLKGKIEGLPSNFATLIADTEKTFKATKNYSQGDYLIVNNQLYKVSSAITSGSTITPGTNVTATTIMAEIMALA